VVGISREERDARLAANTAELLAAIDTFAAEHDECVRLLASVDAKLDEFRGEFLDGFRADAVGRGLEFADTTALLESLLVSQAEIKTLLIQALDQ